MQHRIGKEARAADDAATDAALASAAAPDAGLLAPAEQEPGVLLNAPVDVRSASLAM